MKMKLLAIALFSLGMFLSACASGAEKVEYTVEMTEFAYSPNLLELKVGQEVTLHLVNIGALDHELMIGREMVLREDQPSGYMADMFEGHEPTVSMVEEMDHDMGHGHGGFMVTVPKGSESTSMTFTVTEDMVGHK
ncbi:MAG: hypothetical protein HC806_02160, partial [Anaerolineae bacterium]|nr:hypothetical protein [Anaerolineae bacterium]